MLKEYHYDHLIRWPNNERAAVFLTFDFQGGEDVKPDKNGILNYEMWSQGEYGPHHAIYRVLANSEGRGRQGDLPDMRRDC